MCSYCIIPAHPWFLISGLSRNDLQVLLWYLVQHSYKQPLGKITQLLGLNFLIFSCSLINSSMCCKISTAETWYTFWPVRRYWMCTGDVKVSRIPHRSAPPSPRPPKGCGAVLQLFTKPPWMYCMKHFVLFVPHNGFAFPFWHLATIKACIPHSY